MFHTYILGHNARRVDMGRPQFLMDKGLLREAIDWVANNREQLLDNHNGDERFINENQAIWDKYVSLHWKKYDKPFQPHVDPNWD